MVTADLPPDGFVPPQDFPVSDAADATTVTYKFENLKMSDHSASTEQCDVPDPMEITGQFKRLDISGSSPSQIDSNSAQNTTAAQSHTSSCTKPVHTDFDLSIQHPTQPLKLPSESIGHSEDDFSERYFADDDLHGWTAMDKKGKKRTGNASKRLSKGPIRKKTGGVGRHRHNSSRKSLLN